MSSHEIVCLSSDEEEKHSMPIIVSTRSVAGLNSTIQIGDSEDISNGKFEIEDDENGIESDGAEPGTSSCGPKPKKRRVELVTVDKSKPDKTDGELSPKKKSRKVILAEENKKIFEELLTKCEEVDCSADMKKGTAKARKHFENAQIEFISSTEFKTLLEENLTKITKECVWGHLGEMVKQLKLYKEREGDLNGSQKEKDQMKEQLAATDKDKYYQVLKNEEDERIVNKLTRILKKIHKQILKLETQEVDFDEDNDSSYIMLERYKARASKIYEKLCQYTRFPEHAERMSKRKITFAGTDIPSVNKCIERFVNKNHCFPDYQDVLKLIQTVNTSESLNISSLDVKAMASKAFREIGREIKRRRQWDVEDSLYIHLDRGDFKREVYENDPELQAKLDDNGKIFVKKFNDMIEEYTQKQLKEQKSDEEKGEKGESPSSENGGGSTEANSGDEDDSMKEEDDESDEEASDIEKPVDEEFDSDNERSEEDSVSDDEKNLADDKQLSADDKELSADDKELSADDKELTADEEEPTADGDEPMADGEEPTADTDEPTADGEEPTADGEEPTADVEENKSSVP